ncbi:MAG: hypothetical protein HC893_14255 [Chloroflexaceae bacterium]|nr:hypothetical protein [Chloroflexaceae bacterium]NJL34792.1 hypothetical protein [Chloroflexaceae bacterium]NJO06137.1 hypothetical protein [Chloroflexaceae bacterium]
MDNLQSDGDEETVAEELARLAQETLEAQAGSSSTAAMRERCQRIIELFAKGAILEARDNFHAALVLLYGERLSHYDLARTFAWRAAKLGESRSWSVYAMAWDRWLIAAGKPQRFGTQIIRLNGRWTLGLVDPEVNDQQRAMYGVLPLYVQEERAKQLQRQEESDT